MVIKKKESEQVLTCCTWGGDVRSLLPKTDLIGLISDSSPLAVHKWERVREVVGDLMELDPDLYPPRYLVREFPSAAQLAELGPSEL